MKRKVKKNKEVISMSKFKKEFTDLVSSIIGSHLTQNTVECFTNNLNELLNKYKIDFNYNLIINQKGEDIKVIPASLKDYKTIEKIFNSKK